MASFFLTQVLEKMASRDKDIRFMATHDLANEMEKESFKMDPLMEQKIVEKLLTLVDDNANNVQENVVKCLGLMIKFVKDQHAQNIADSLIKGLLESEKEELHEISSIGLKTIIGNMIPDSTVATLVTKRVSPKMLDGISASKPGDKTEVKMYCLDILNYLLTKYGSLVPQLDQVRDVVLPNLNAIRPATRKRAINCLASFAIPASDDLFYGLMDNIIKQIDEAKKGDHISTLVQLIGQIGRSSGYRLGKYLSKIMPYIIKNVDNSKFEQNDELKENCLLCFEAIVEKCQKDVSPFLKDIISLSSKYIKFDPNYQDDEEEEEDDEMETDQEDDDDEQDDDEEDVSDDDDISWKIRRSAAKTLTAVILYRPELLLYLFENVSPILISRFKEREENVKLEIFTTFILLLKQLTKKNVDVKCYEVLRQQVVKLVTLIKKSLNDKSIKIRVGAFQLLKELIVLIPGILAEHVNSLIGGITLSLGEKNNNSNLKIEALSFLRVLFSNHPAQVFYPHAKTLSVQIVKCVKESYYRIASEALRVCQEFVIVLRPNPQSTFDFKPFVNELYEATLVQLRAQDTDQEVKESAISCMGTIIAVFGDVLASNQLGPCLLTLLDRLENEITRVVSLKAISKIVVAPTKVDLSSIMPKTIDNLTTFLRKNNRSLKQTTISTFNDITTHFPNSINNNQLPLILQELSLNINESDLQLTHLSFIFYRHLLITNGKLVGGLLKEKFLPSTLALLKSSLLQGVALESLLGLLSDIITIKETGVGYSELLNALMDTANQIKQPVTRQSYASISQCIAIITVVATNEQRSSTVEKLIKNLGTDNDSLVLLSLTCIGEIGRRTSLASFGSIQNDIFKTFDANSEEIKQVAALSLGNIAVSSLSTYIPFILDHIKSQPKKQYLLLHSLRETIVKLYHSNQGIAVIVPFLPAILPLLYENSVNEEEGTRNLVAECLGKLAMADPNNIIPQLESKIGGQPLERATVVTSIKFSILESKSVENHLAPVVTRFLVLLNDPDLVVKRAALLTLNYISHNRPSLIRDQLAIYLPILYNNCRIKPELIREVDLGPFKHKVDDGIEIRKTAFECMYTLLDTSSDKIEIAPFVESIAAGLKDTQHDIKLLCHLLVVRLASVNGQALLEGLTALVEPFKLTLLAKVQDANVKQQVERNDECIRSALRAIASIHRIPSSESIVKFEEFIRTTIRSNPKLNTTFVQILEEDNSIHDEKMDTSD